MQLESVTAIIHRDKICLITACVLYICQLKKDKSLLKGLILFHMVHLINILYTGNRGKKYATIKLFNGE